VGSYDPCQPQRRVRAAIYPPADHCSRLTSWQSPADATELLLVPVIGDAAEANRSHCHSHGAEALSFYRRSTWRDTKMTVGYASD